MATTYPAAKTALLQSKPKTTNQTPPTGGATGPFTPGPNLGSYIASPGLVPISGIEGASYTDGLRLTISNSAAVTVVYE